MDVEKVNPNIVGGGWTCCVEHCQSRSSTKYSKLKYHRFPKNKALAKKWLHSLGIKQDAHSLYYFQRKRICGLHFTLQDGMKKIKVPTLFLRKPMISTRPTKSYFDDDGINVVEIEYETQNKANVNLYKKPNPSRINSSDRQYFHEDHNYQFTGSIDQVKNLQIANHHLEMENTYLRTHSNFNIDGVLRKSFLLNFYTGFDDVKRFFSFITIIKNQGQMFRTNFFHKQNSQNTKLSHDHQIFIFFSRLRLGLLEHDLAYRHNISQSSVSKIFNFWLNVIYTYLKQLPLWPNKSLVVKYMPDAFKKLYPSTRIILDATEIKIQKPSDYNNQSKTYSHYKSTNTGKGLIAISPNGFVSFVSEIYPGRISDKDLFLKSGLIQKLEPGDSVMADRGFTIDDELRQVDCDLNIPPFVIKNNQLDELEEQVTKDIASLRIHVERKIGEVKIFNLLKSTIPISTMDQLNKIWIVCSLMPNFSKAPLLDRRRLQAIYEYSISIIVFISKFKISFSYECVDNINILINSSCNLW